MKQFKISDFAKAMLHIGGRKPSIALQRRILIGHVLYLTRNIKTMSEDEIYVEIEKIWKMPDEKLIRKFEKAMK